MRYFVWPGKTKSAGEPHEFFDFRVPAFTPDNEPIYLTPKITTYYGHDLLAPQGVTLIPVATLKKTQLHLITLHRLDADTSLEVTVMCWQGDNDTLHLASPLPTEDEYLGIDHAGVFGTKPADAEKRDYILARLWYGDTAVLDSDIAEIITPGKVLRA
ncbi:hypothetical protein Dxin01_00115 [Deinococcus xinjiangensis]|uniref:Uncharacterized protein n=1 Tax=Deinococcus xinjiangensis TaxID=457454 RepID=A0ABP9V539_9DEIO